MTTPFPDHVRQVTDSDYLALAERDLLRQSKYAAAFDGLAGQFVAMILPHSEADPFALLLQFLTAFGNVIGRCAYQTVEADRHYPNLFVVLVGQTSKSRKGSSWSQVRRLLQDVDESWTSNSLFTGLSTGEGLIHHVRDCGVEGGQQGADSGVADKRALIVASEFASILATMQRRGNTLSSTLRDAWDRGDLRTMTKGSPERATGAHVSIVAHITREELRRQLTTTEVANGFANRFLWASVRRSKSLPEGGALAVDDVRTLAKRVRESVSFARCQEGIQRDADARILWRQIYGELSEGSQGMFGAVTSRAEAQVMRLSGIYALLDRSPLVRQDHLTSAAALWRYCEDSARDIFGKATGDPTAERILRLVINAGEAGRSKSELSDDLSHNVPADRINAALDSLIEAGDLEIRHEPTGGRHATRFYAATKKTK